MIIDEKNILILENKYMPDIRKLVDDDNINEILDRLNDMIIDDILAHDDEPSDVGGELQLIYDRIQSDNF